MDQMQIRILRPGDEAALEGFLLPRSDSSVFLLGNLRSAGLEDRGQRYGGTYAALVSDDRIEGVVAHYWNGNLVLQAPRAAEELARAAVRASGRRVHGLLGPDDQVGRAKAGLRIDPADVQMDETENLYRLRLADLVVPAPLLTGEVRARLIGPADVAQVAGWRAGLEIESLGQGDTPELREQVRAGVEREVQEGRTWVLESDGVPVATCTFHAMLPQVVQIGGVYTPDAQRGRGFAREVIAASLLEAKAAGVVAAVLFTRAGNLPAVRAYAALGFRQIGHYRLLLLREGVTPEI